MSLELFGNANWTSPYVLSCFATLREKCLPFEVKSISLHDGAQHEASFARQSLTSRVPALVDADFALSESSAIVEYLEDAYPAPAHASVFPSSLRDRARARQIMAWVRSDLMALREERSTEYVFYPHADLDPLGPLSPAGVKAATKLVTVADGLVPSTSGSIFGQWCIADTDLAMMLQRLAKTGFDLPKHIRVYAEAQWERPAVKEFCDHVRPPFRRGPYP
jgi:glutathione S-transferase